MKFLRLVSLTLAVAATLSACGGSSSIKIGGQISGLASGGTVVLQNTTNGDTLSYAFNSSSNTFTFGKSLNSGDSYNVIVTSQPTGQTCSITDGSGTVNSGDVTNIQVTCSAGSGTAVPLSASVVGLADGATLVLTDVAAGILTVTGTAATASGGTLNQNFPTSLLPSAAYNTTIKTQPTGQTCTITGNTGTGTIPVSGNPSPEVVSCS